MKNKFTDFSYSLDFMEVDKKPVLSTSTHENEVEWVKKVSNEEFDNWMDEFCNQLKLKNELDSDTMLSKMMTEMIDIDILIKLRKTINNRY